MSDIEEHDGLNYWRCPPLGGPVQFKHCRKENEGLPCRRIAGCWVARIDLSLFLKNNYSPAELEKALCGLGKGRLDTIFEALDRAREVTGGESG